MFVYNLFSDWSSAVLCTCLMFDWVYSERGNMLNFPCSLISEYVILSQCCRTICLFYSEINDKVWALHNLCQLSHLILCICKRLLLHNQFLKFGNILVSLLNFYFKILNMEYTASAMCSGLLSFLLFLLCYKEN